MRTQRAWIEAFRGVKRCKNTQDFKIKSLTRNAGRLRELDQIRPGEWQATDNFASWFWLRHGLAPLSGLFVGPSNVRARPGQRWRSAPRPWRPTAWGPTSSNFSRGNLLVEGRSPGRLRKMAVTGHLNSLLFEAHVTYGFRVGDSLETRHSFCSPGRHNQQTVAPSSYTQHLQCSRSKASNCLHSHLRLPINQKKWFDWSQATYISST